VPTNGLFPTSIVFPVEHIVAVEVFVAVVGAAFTKGKLAVLLTEGVKSQFGVTSVREIPVIVIVCPLFAAVNAIVLKVALPAEPVTIAVCVPAVPPTV
jgi:hypothetical protein